LLEGIFDEVVTNYKDGEIEKEAAGRPERMEKTEEEIENEELVIIFLCIFLKKIFVVVHFPWGLHRIYEVLINKD